MSEYTDLHKKLRKQLSKKLNISLDGHSVHLHNGFQPAICENHDYHMLLHYRARALKESGHVDWWRCRICKLWGPKEDFHEYGKDPKRVHKTCDSQAALARYFRRREQR